MRWLNKEQKLFFYLVLHSIKVSDEPLRPFLTGGAGVGKSWLTNALYETLVRHLNGVAGDNPDNVKVLKLLQQVKLHIIQRETLFIRHFKLQHIEDLNTVLLIMIG